jgi:hypothetical protein
MRSKEGEDVGSIPAILHNIKFRSYASKCKYSLAGKISGCQSDVTSSNLVICSNWLVSPLFIKGIVNVEY